MASALSPIFQPSMYALSTSSTVESEGMLTVLDMAPETNGWTAAIMRTCPCQAIERLPLRGVKAQSNTGRSSSRSVGAPSMVSLASM